MAQLYALMSQLALRITKHFQNIASGSRGWATCVLTCLQFTRQLFDQLVERVSFYIGLGCLIQIVIHMILEITCIQGLSPAGA